MLDPRVMHRKFEHAIETALPFQPVSENNSEFFDRLRSCYDDEPVTIDTDWEPGPGQVAVDNIDDFPKLFKYLGAATGLFRDDKSIAYLTRHEGQHGEAARVQGAKRSLFGIELVRSDVTHVTPEGVDLRLAFEV